MTNITIAGFGNIGQAVLCAVRESPDMALQSIVSSQAIDTDVPVLRDVSEITGADVVILCVPSRLTPDMAETLLKRGIRTVDSYDIHGSVAKVRKRLNQTAKEHGTAAVISAGWDPGSDSVVRALLLAMMPKGITYTNFGPGMSMGHTVAVKAIPGVRDALSLTIPLGTGLHRRMVYVELEQGADFSLISDAIKADDYFIHDETHVIQATDIDALQDMGHGVHLERKGVSGGTHNQRATFEMGIQNPALTGQILVSAARAVMKQAPGCYTMIEIPPIDYLYGDPEDLVRKLV